MVKSEDMRFWPIVSLTTAVLALPISPSFEKTLSTCFSPLGHCDQVMVTWINAAQKTLDGAIYGVTDEKIAQAFISAHKRGVRVRLVHDRTQAAGRKDLTALFTQAKIPV